MKYPDITVNLIGFNGNAFFILGKCIREMKRAGLGKEVQDEFVKEATSGNYDKLLATCLDWFDVQ